VVLRELLSEQRTFYDQRAEEWPEFIERYMGPLGERFDRLLAGTSGLTGSRMLELAAGTGYLTRRLAPIADHITALDSSPSMLTQLEGLALPNVSTLCADVFDWSPRDRYGAVACANWLSHVPRELWQAHWEMLDRALAPDGVIVVIDATLDEREHLGGHPWWQARLDDGHREPLTTRALNDGRRFTVVKQFWEPDALLAQIQPLGWVGEAVRIHEDRGLIFYRIKRAQ